MCVIHANLRPVVRDRTRSWCKQKTCMERHNEKLTLLDYAARKKDIISRTKHAQAGTLTQLELAAHFEGHCERTFFEAVSLHLAECKNLGVSKRQSSTMRS